MALLFGVGLVTLDYWRVFQTSSLKALKHRISGTCVNKEDQTTGVCLYFILHICIHYFLQ